MKKYSVKKRHKWQVLTFMIMFAALAVLGGCSNNNGSSGLGSNPPKKVSIAKEAKSNGVYIWEDAKGYAKDSLVSNIIVFDNGKGSTYRIYDKDITLGKLSSMKDNQIIDLAKKQDKKNFNMASKEIKATIKGKTLRSQNNEWYNMVDSTPSIGLERIYNPNNDGSNIITIKKLLSANDVKSDKYNNTDSDDPNIIYDVEEIGDLAVQNDSDSKSPIFTDYWNAIAKYMDNMKYHVPRKFTLKISSNTDSTGNNITDQKATIVQNEEISSSFLKDQNTKLYKMTKKDPDLAKRINEQLTLNYNNSDNASELMKKNESKIFSKKELKELTNGVGGHYYYDYGYRLDYTTSFDIYKAKYIGYARPNGNYLVTKAQNDKQKAVFSK